MKDPFVIPTVLTAQEVLDKAFGRATKVVVKDRVPFHQKRHTAAARVTSAGDIIASTMDRTIKAFPSFDNLHPFLREMAALSVDVEQVRKSLGALQWAKGQVRDICRKSAAQIKRTKDSDYVEKKRSEAFGRISSVVNQVGGDLELLGKARDTLKIIPAVDPYLPTVVVAGVPNVGKSAMVRRLSTARPKVAQYPFTTREIHVGVFESGRRRYQVIDTPGLLDRAPDERNDIERRAAAALRHLGAMVIFLMDPSGECGYSVGVQESLLQRIIAEFPDSPFQVVETRVDIMDSGSKRMKVSGETGQGVEELRAEIVRNLKADPGAVDRELVQLMRERESEDGFEVENGDDDGWG